MTTNRAHAVDIFVRDAESGLSRVTIEGDLDIHTAPQLERALHALLEEGRNRFVLDFSSVGFMDSAGLGVILAAQRRATAVNGRILILCKSVRIRRLFIITGLTRLFEVVDDDASLEALLASDG